MHILWAAFFLERHELTISVLEVIKWYWAVPSTGFDPQSAVLEGSLVTP
jgi:hypothetical protein